MLFTKIIRNGLLFATLCFLFVGCGTKQEVVPKAGSGASSPALAAVKFKQKVIGKNLNTPAGLAVQSGSGDVFVSTADGIVRLDSDHDYQAAVEIVGFETDSYGKGPDYSFGPLGLGFVDSKTLAVGGGGRNDGEDIVWVFDVGTEPSSPPLGTDRAKDKFGPFVASDDSLKGEGNFFGLYTHDNRIYVSSHGDDAKGWVSTIDLSNKSSKKIQPLIAAKTSTFVDGPSCLAVLPNGKLLLSLTGELHESPDSALAIFDIATGKLEKTIKPGLYDITSFAFEPKTGNLFVTDFAWARPELGGLYLVDIENDGVAVKCASLLHPTAMAFLPDGGLAVACVGAQYSDDGKRPPQGEVYLLTR